MILFSDPTDKVLDFISHFTFKGKYQQVIDSFTCGNCYWFAFILNHRFDTYNTFIVYDNIENHFGCYIEGKVYDITGDITDKYGWLCWDEMYNIDPAHYKRILRDCVLQINPEDCE